MGLAAAQNFRVLFQAIRQKYYNPKARDFSSWNGGWVHAVDDFGELKLGL